jgi:hypothetical protein
METPSSIFTPKYTPVAYIVIFACFGVFVFLVAAWIIRRTLLPGEDNWVAIYWGVAFGLTGLYEGSKLIKVIEFHTNEMTVQYHFGRKRSIEYRGIKGINTEWSYLDTIRGKIYLYGMENLSDLLMKVIGILGEKKILEIDVKEEDERFRIVRYKRLRYAIIITVAIGLLAEFVGNADWSYFYIILILYFVLAYQILRLFIK